MIVEVVSTPENCQCCAGAVELYGMPCLGCQAAMERGDRRGHPHLLSAAQRALADESEVGGGRVDGEALVATKDGRSVVLGFEEL